MEGGRVVEREGGRERLLSGPVFNSILCPLLLLKTCLDVFDVLETHTPLKPVLFYIFISFPHSHFFDLCSSLDPSAEHALRLPVFPLVLSVSASPARVLFLRLLLFFPLPLNPRHSLFAPCRYGWKVEWSPVLWKKSLFCRRQTRPPVMIILPTFLLMEALFFLQSVVSLWNFN